MVSLVHCLLDILKAHLRTCIANQLRPDVPKLFSLRGPTWKLNSGPQAKVKLLL